MKHMNNFENMFSTFYSSYDYGKIQETYYQITNQLFFSGFHTSYQLDIEVRMKNDILAMQINFDNAVSTEFVTIVGYFFNNYSSGRNCVWTKKEKSILDFFDEGISIFLKFNAKLRLNILDDEKRKLVELLANRRNKVDEILLTRLCEKFTLLETMNWQEFIQKIESEIQDEEKRKHIENITSMELPPDWINIFSSDERAAGISAKTPAEGLFLSLNNLGYVDIEYISQITGADYKTVICALKGSIYQNPYSWNECFYKGWETADEYLSGRVVDKLKKAKEANEEYNGYFSDNVEALKRVIPNTVAVDDIYVALGSPWVPADIIDDFIASTFRDRRYLHNEKYNIRYDEKTGTWKIPQKVRFAGTFLAEETFGTKRMNALQIIEKTLNMKTVFVTDEAQSTTNKSGKKRVCNKEETLLAQEKQKKITEAFKTWVWQDEVRKERLLRIYNERYCSSIIRRYDGSFLDFPDMNPEENLREYQKNAIARIIFSPNTLLAHDVGAGKTYVMICAGMKMRSMGISKKNMYVVPNTITGQWKEMFLKLYPKANILCVEPNGFTKEKRQAVLEDIKDNDYDAVIMAYSSFELIPMSKNNYRERLKLQIAEIIEKSKKNYRLTTSQSKKINALESALKELDAANGTECKKVFFDDLGINTLFVDEAHNFKNVPVETKITNVLGVSTVGSSKCQDMMDKVKTIQKANGGRGIVFATGTPISNSLTDIFVMQKYLQSEELAMLGLESFDSWVGMFAERNSEFEIDVDVNNFRMATRFTKFHNMPELSTLLSSVSDFYSVDKTNGIPEKDGYKDIIISKTPEFAKYLAEISARADEVRNKNVSLKDDNMLKITTDGRKAALDLRLVDNSAVLDYQCKAMRCAEAVFDIYLKTADKELTQLIFCDTSTPKQSFNLYDELKRLLVSMGMAPEKIAYIHDAVSEKKREELFEKVRQGVIRVLIGSTFKLGLGVNVQDKLFALHHLDVPWRPSDMIQREGRILRNGNQNEKIDIYRYIAEGSFDSYSWQLLEAKQRMINAILSGCMTERMCEEIADVVLDYAEVKAISIGNPLLKIRVETANELTRNIVLQRKLIEARQAMEIELAEIPHKIKHQQLLIENCEQDIAFYSKNKTLHDKFTRKELRQLVHNAIVKGELATEEYTACSYQGFDVVIPANMLKTKPFVYLQKNGRYQVEMGLSEKGTLIRLDNFLGDMEEYCNRLKEGLEKLQNRENDIIHELSKSDDYADIIERLKSELKNIDKKLGV